MSTGAPDRAPAVDTAASLAPVAIVRAAVTRPHDWHEVVNRYLAGVDLDEAVALAALVEGLTVFARFEAVTLAVALSRDVTTMLDEQERLLLAAVTSAGTG